MRAQPLTGGKVRRLRLARGLTQAELARRLEISASYLNLIEHDQRALTTALRRSVARILEVDERRLSGREEARTLADLEEVFGDDLLAADRPGEEELRDLVLRAPAAARAIQKLYGSLTTLRGDVRLLAERLSGDPELGSIALLPSDEVSDLLQRHGNYFPELEEAAKRFWKDARLDPDAMRSCLKGWLRDRHGITTVVAPGEADLAAVRRYDADARVLRISEVLPRSTVVFQLAHQIGLLDLVDVFDEIATTSPLSTPESKALARIALANYFAGAVTMPYEPFFEAARTNRYDVELLEHRFRTSFEQVCHRLTTMSRPGARGVPFHLIRIDIAGNISKRYSGSGIRIARYSGACPRWNVHAAFLTPGQIRTQISQMTDGTKYFCIARTVRKAGGGHRVPESRLAMGMGCELRHARELVYADGVDLEHPEAAVPVGVSCRVCDRMDCRQRAFPPVHHELDVDENVRGISFYYSPPVGTPAADKRS